MKLSELEEDINALKENQRSIAENVVLTDLKDFKELKLVFTAIIKDVEERDGQILRVEEENENIKKEIEVC